MFALGFLTGVAVSGAIMIVIVRRREPPYIIAWWQVSFLRSLRQLYLYYRGRREGKPGWNDYSHRPRRPRKAFKMAWYYARKGYTL